MNNDELPGYWNQMSPDEQLAYTSARPPTPKQWEPPKYSIILAYEPETFSSCDRCGTAVFDTSKHTDYHRGVQQISEAAQALTHLVFPGVERGKFVRNVTSIIIPGGEGGEGAVIDTSGSITIGKGGSGSNPDIPRCPICEAYGGGGHGGNCPNSGRPVSQWEGLSK
jgi:hypothetical protein